MDENADIAFRIVEQKPASSVRKHDDNKDDEKAEKTDAFRHQEREEKNEMKT